MIKKAAITIAGPRDEVERAWQSSEHRVEDAVATFVEAPGGRGTEIHLELDATPPAGRLGEAIQKLAGSEPLAKAKDSLRRFKQVLETGVISRSDAAPEGERVGRKLKQRPAQPLEV